MSVVPDGATIGQDWEDTCIVHHSHVGLIHAADSVAKHLKTGGDCDTFCHHGFDVLFVTEFGVKENSKPSRKACGQDLDGLGFSVKGASEGWGVFKLVIL